MNVFEAMLFILKYPRLRRVEDFIWKWAGTWSMRTRHEMQKDLEVMLAFAVAEAIAVERTRQDQTRHTRSQDHQSLSQPRPRSLASSAAFDKSGLSVLR